MAMEHPHRPAKLGALLDLLGGLQRVHFWRGVADASWPLHSTIVRRLMQQPHPQVNERSAAFWERDLLARARHRGYGTFSGERLGDFELLALLRHHGAATRLVDFTRSAGVALWFAASHASDVEGQLIGVNTDYVGGYSEGEPIGDDYMDVLDRVTETNFLLTWQPMGSTTRVAAQHSQFLFGRIERLSYGSMRLPVEKAGGVVAVALSPELKIEVLGFLRRVLDIGAQTMFPDLSGFAAAYSANPPEDPYRW